MEYTLEILSKEFLQHSKDTDELRKQMLEDYRANYPDEPIPDHLLQEFSLPSALLALVEEVRLMRLKVDELQEIVDKLGDE